jgi:hypothetical protein
VGRLRAAGYLVHTQAIPIEITPKNRLLLAEPRSTSAGSEPGGESTTKSLVRAPSDRAE